MTTLNPLLARVTHPQRKPFVRSHTFVDGVGPPPYSFFDETQDHAGALYHTALGWKWSLDSDEFTETGARPGFLGRMRIIISSGVTVAPKTTGLTFSEHGMWEAKSGTTASQIIAQSGDGRMAGDFLLTAKVMLRGRERFDASIAGFAVYSGAVRIYAASTWPNWRVNYTSATGSTVDVDSGVPALNDTWYRLQISRVATALRFHINGCLIPINGRGGAYLPGPLSAAKSIGFTRPAPGPAGDGFAIDSFHLLAERT